MLDIYPFILETLAVLRPVAERIARADADLGRQLRRAQVSPAFAGAVGVTGERSGGTALDSPTRRFSNVISPKVSWEFLVWRRRRPG